MPRRRNRIWIINKGDVTLFVANIIDGRCHWARCIPELADMSEQGAIDLLLAVPPQVMRGKHDCMQGGMLLEVLMKEMPGMKSMLPVDPTCIGSAGDRLKMRGFRCDKVFDIETEGLRTGRYSSSGPNRANEPKPAAGTAADICDDVAGPGQPTPAAAEAREQSGSPDEVGFSGREDRDGLARVSDVSSSSRTDGGDGHSA